ncbi:MAG: dihydroxyacetone kinase subunit DhaL [Trueperella sp.]|nr:dihydroxyacetone kinase subunit DhaL [Trueperella sp.]
MESAPFIAWLAAFQKLVTANSDYLTELDRQIGDADHGANMLRGVEAIGELDPAEFPDAGSYLKKAGMTLVSKVGGASGPLYGTLLLKMGAELDTDPAAELTAGSFVAALAAGVAGVQARGRAEVGDKTMLDAWLPALAAAQETAANGETLADTVAAAYAAAQQGAAATIPLVARKGRASYLGERAVGVKDPGAASTELMLQAAAEVFGG